MEFQWSREGKVLAPFPSSIFHSLSIPGLALRNMKYEQARIISLIEKYEKLINMKYRIYEILRNMKYETWRNEQARIISLIPSFPFLVPSQQASLQIHMIPTSTNTYKYK